MPVRRRRRISAMSQSSLDAAACGASPSGRMLDMQFRSASVRPRSARDARRSAPRRLRPASPRRSHRPGPRAPAPPPRPGPRHSQAAAAGPAAAPGRAAARQVPTIRRTRRTGWFPAKPEAGRDRTKAGGGQGPAGAGTSACPPPRCVPPHSASQEARGPPAMPRHPAQRAPRRVLPRVRQGSRDAPRWAGRCRHGRGPHAPG